MNNIFSVTVPIPVLNNRRFDRSVKSVIKYCSVLCEVIILRNDVNTLNNEIVFEFNRCSQKEGMLVRIVDILERGKGNALNIGLNLSKTEVVCIVDADTEIRANSIEIALKYFDNEDVVAVGGRLVVRVENANYWQKVQHYEYKRSFNIIRRILYYFRAQHIVSGAFGFFRRDFIMQKGGYDRNSVGEDMELVLRIQERVRAEPHCRIVYAFDSVAVTKTPNTFNTLFYQRERWQRGLFDSLIIHRKMILNPRFGLLGMFVLPYQIIIELLGPVYAVIYIFCPPLWELFPRCLIPYVCWLVFHTIFTFIAEFLETGLSWYLLRKVPKIFFYIAS